MKEFTNKQLDEIIFHCLKSLNEIEPGRYWLGRDVARNPLLKDFGIERDINVPNMKLIHTLQRLLKYGVIEGRQITSVGDLYYGSIYWTYRIKQTVEVIVQ